MRRGSKQRAAEGSRRFYITVGLVVIAVLIGLSAILNQGGLTSRAGLETDSALSTSAAQTPTPPPTETPIPPTATETLALPTQTPLPSPTLTIPPTVSVAPPPAKASSGEQWISGSDGMALVFVPAGKFLMGSLDSDPQADSDEKPQHTVSLDAFWIDRTEVTNAMFARFVAATGYETDAEREGGGKVFGLSDQKWEQTAGADWRHPRGPATNIDGLDNHPAVSISWNDANTYCQWAGRRLPTEAEWEKAARGPDGRKYPWGDTAPAGNLLNFADRNLDQKWSDKTADDGYEFTASVGHYPAGASPYGALDMAGNVWEWTVDWYIEDYYAHSPAQNPVQTIPALTRVLRGGSWLDKPQYLRATNRNWINQDFAGDLIGFRCVRSGIGSG